MRGHEDEATSFGDGGASALIGTTDVDGVLEGAGFDREVGNETGGLRGNAGGVVTDRCLGGFGAFADQNGVPFDVSAAFLGLIWSGAGWKK